MVKITFKMLAVLTTLLGVFAIFLWLPVTYSEKVVFSIFLFAVCFWSFQIIPLYATSLLIVVFLTIFLSIPQFFGLKPHLPLNYFFIPFASPVIFLFFGGFTLAKALQKHQIDKYFIIKIINFIGNKPAVLLISLTFLAAFLSMWISNTASAAMMLMLIQPIIKQFDNADLFKKGLILSIAFGANAGGLLTPIGTPPNAIALGVLREINYHIDFMKWISLSLPIGIVFLIIISSLLVFWFNPKEQITFPTFLLPKMNTQAKFTLGLMILVVLLWLTTSLHHIPESIVALLGVAALVVFRLISKEDIRNIPWDILILMWGGLALGEGIQITGIGNRLAQTSLLNFHPFLTITIFAIIAVFLSSFISNTAAANLLLPIALVMPFTNPQCLVITTAFACSFAYAFPISTPPNAIAYSTNVLKLSDMLKPGILLSAIGLCLILLSVQYITLILN